LIGKCSNAEFKIKGIAPGDNHRQIIAFLRGLNEESCRELNVEFFGSPQIPQLTHDQRHLYSSNMVSLQDGDYIPLKEEPTDIASEALVGQTNGCFESHDGGEYVYFGRVFEF
jgi:hypothetical protein